MLRMVVWSERICHVSSLNYKNLLHTRGELPLLHTCVSFGSRASQELTFE